MNCQEEVKKTVPHAIFAKQIIQMSDFPDFVIFIFVFEFIKKLLDQ